MDPLGGRLRPNSSHRGQPSRLLVRARDDEPLIGHLPSTLQNHHTQCERIDQPKGGSQPPGYGGGRGSVYMIVAWGVTAEFGAFCYEIHVVV